MGRDMSENAPIKRLRDAMPREFMGYTDIPAFKWADIEVIAEYDGTEPGQHWPGKERNVYCWVALKNGRAVGWNENPGRGWSFPLIRFTPPPAIKENQ